MDTCEGVRTDQGDQPRTTYKGLAVAQYMVMEAIGDGHLGRTFRAVDVAEHCDVALKIIPRRVRYQGGIYSTRSIIKRATAAAELEHPLIDLVYEVGQQSDIYYIASELASSGSVQEKILAEGSLNVRSAIGCILNAAEALAFAHHHKIVHGNLRPNDLLINPGCYCKVRDFGLITADFPGSRHPPLSIFGRPRYLAPEVIVGDYPSVQADVYSLGATLFFLLAGVAPFLGESYEDVVAEKSAPCVPDIRLYRRDVTEDLARVISRAMAHDPEDRYRGAHAFMDAVGSVQHSIYPEVAVSPLASMLANAAYQ